MSGETTLSTDQPDHDTGHPEPNPLDDPTYRAQAILDVIMKATGGSKRQGQVDMARYTAYCLANDISLVIEGGTGTGKTIGYIAGALAAERHTCIAPHTKALQTQIGEDLAATCEALSGHPLMGGRDLTYAILKGRSAYACLAKLRPTADAAGQDTLGEDAAAAEPSSQLGKEFLAIRKWSEDTFTGDRDDVPFPVSDKTWALASVTSDNCTAKACPFYKDGSCFAEIAKNAAKEADIKVLNHKLLTMGMKLPFILPEDIGAVIVDEAHEFPSSVASTFGAELTASRMDNCVKQVGAVLRASAKNTQVVADAVEEANSAIEHFTKTVRAPKNPDMKMLNNPPVASAIDGCRDAFERLRSLSVSLPQATEEEQVRKDQTKKMLGNLIDDLVLVQHGTDDNQVAWVEANRDNKPIIKSAMYDTSETIYEKLLLPYKSVAFTSATMTVEGSFDRIKEDLGVDRGMWRTAIVNSPFNYQEQALLYFPPNMPDPADTQNAEAYRLAVAEVARKFIEAAQGRTMMLCASHASVRTIGDALRDSLPPTLPVLSQGGDLSTGELTRRFASDPHTSLVGAATFWTGISVEGDTNAVTIVEKIPFPTPSDPIIAARSAKADRTSGRGAGFQTVTKPAGIRTFVQGTGRNIRSVSDRGLIVVCDPRLNPQSRLKKNYAGSFMRSLPPYPVTYDEETALAFVRHINETARDGQVRVEVEVEEADEDASQ